ncbi:hypothetical protein QYE76_020681 [Lolium multiflorum]|uniref:Reverse transcriptase zinc-binding domain-containing protein n=1 Tax=Lolium multiflorum TaxID=4521 RepID=A0AAD8R942_LOLMU|nr:hypothetical protein QYE76_020681 [Lolium multiflorum]
MPLADRHPALFSHVTMPQASVATVISSGFSLQPRLSSATERELRAVVILVGSAALGDGQDLHCIDSPSAPPFSLREAYRMLSPQHGKDVSSCTSWGLLLPAKVRLFSYLADIDMLNTWSKLLFKNCAPSDVCAACPSTEMGRHLFFDCLLASEGAAGGPSPTTTPPPLEQAPSRRCRRHLPRWRRPLAPKVLGWRSGGGSSVRLGRHRRISALAEVGAASPAWRRRRYSLMAVASLRV